MIELLLTMAFEFFKTGLFAVGGGLATIPFLNEMAERYGWFTTETLSTMIAVSESTPGPMGINMATYVGYNLAGVIGSLVTTLSIVTPSIIVICIIAKYLKKFKELTIVEEIFSGLKPAVIAFIVAAVLDLFLSTLFNLDLPFGLGTFNFISIALLAILLMVSYRFKDIHPIFFIVAAAILGMIFKL